MSILNNLQYHSKKLAQIRTPQFRAATLLLLGFTIAPAIANNEVIPGAEQFNPTGVITGNGWANAYREYDNSLQILPYVVIDGMAIHDGDMVLGPVSQFQTLPSSADSSAQNGVALSNVGRRWKDGLVPYVIDASYSTTDRDAILSGINHIAEKTSITFVQRTSEPDYVKVFPGGGCSSSIGRTRRGEQTISIGNNCAHLGVVAHEFFHALGVFHEQSRADRDSFVTINFGNIRAGFEGNFKKAGSGSIDIGSYDYKSIMHYGKRGFSKNGNDTITVPSGVTIGSRSGLSTGDIATMQYLYYTDLQLDLTTVSETDPGSTVQVSIKITNQGDSDIGNIKAKAVKVSLPIPNQSTYTGFTSTDSWTCQQVSQNVECIINGLDRSSNSTLNINLTAPTNLNSMQLNPTVSASNRDIQTANNSKSATITITNLTDMSVSLSLSKTTLDVADILTTTFNLNNSSQIDAQQISVAITSVAALTYRSFNGSGWSCTNASTTTTCTLPTLAKSTSTQFSINYEAVAAVANANISVSVSSQNTDGDLSNNNSSAAFSIKTPPPPPTTTLPPTTAIGSSGESGGGAFDWFTLFLLSLTLPLINSPIRLKSHSG